MFSVRGKSALASGREASCPRLASAKGCDTWNVLAIFTLRYRPGQMAVKRDVKRSLSICSLGVVTKLRKGGVSVTAGRW